MPETPQAQTAPRTEKAPKTEKTQKPQRAKARWNWQGGVMLEQHKDPILSQELVPLIDPERQKVIPELRPWDDISEIAPEDIIQVARLARIVDERDGYPLFR